MAERRSLAEGLKPPPPPLDVTLEKDFVFGNKNRTAVEATAAPVVSRSPLSTRIRADFAAALKRASLERQLKGIAPNTLQDILEEAIEPWLKSHDYLP